MANGDFNLSNEIEHNRQLVRRGLMPAEDAEALNNWLIRVDSISRLGDRSFTEVAAEIPSPLPWKGFTSADNGSEVTPGRVHAVGKRGTRIERF